MPPLQNEKSQALPAVPAGQCSTHSDPPWQVGSQLNASSHVTSQVAFESQSTAQFVPVQPTVHVLPSQRKSQFTLEQVMSQVVPEGQLPSQFTPSQL